MPQSVHAKPLWRENIVETKSRLPIIAFVSSILLPYGISTAGTPMMTTNQYWLFPLWTYVHDFGTWLGMGVIIPPFLPSFSLLPPISRQSGVLLGSTLVGHCANSIWVTSCGGDGSP
jgi:hypothetical protein